MFKNIGNCIKMYLHRKIIYFILVVLVMLIPSIKMLTHIYYIFSSFFLIILFSICFLLVNNIPLHIRIGVILIILAAFRTNVSMTGSLFAKFSDFAYIHPISTRNDDSLLRKYAHDVFSENFELHTNFDNLPSIPSIIVSNYCQNRMENVGCMMIPRNIAIMMRRGLTILGLHKIVKWPLFTEASGNYEKTKGLVMGHILQGHHVFSYVTTKSLLRPDLFMKIRSGMFSIAQELNVPITPIVFDYIDTPFGCIPYQRYEICVGDTFYVNDVGKSKLQVVRFFKDKMAEFMKKKYECKSIKKY